MDYGFSCKTAREDLLKSSLPLLSKDRPMEATLIDSPLESRVITALERNPYVSRRDLRFETHQGRVTLRGIVHSYFQKQMAQESLRHIEGIDEIENELEVSWA
jgi:osmotically-inducible protein OsmY